MKKYITPAAIGKKKMIIKITRLYLESDESMSQTAREEEVAMNVGCSRQTVHRHLKNKGII